MCCKHVLLEHLSSFHFVYGTSQRPAGARQATQISDAGLEDHGRPESVHPSAGLWPSVAGGKVGISVLDLTLQGMLEIRTLVGKLPILKCGN